MPLRIIFTVFIVFIAALVLSGSTNIIYNKYSKKKKKKFLEGSKLFYVK